MRRWGWMVVLAACGDNLAGPDAPGRDAAVFVPGPNLVTIDVTEDTTDVMYRNDGIGPWGIADKISATEYQIHITDAYEVIAACGAEWSGDSELHARVLADGDRDWLFCQLPSPLAHSVPTTVAVTGQMQQAGIVSFGYDVDSSSAGPWTYSLDVYPGTFDFIAQDTAKQIAIRRDQVITGATTLPALDMIDEGNPTTERSFLVFAPEIGEFVTLTTLLFTQTGFMDIVGTDHSIREVSPSQLVADDEQWIEVLADGETTRRGALGPIGGRNSVELMPRLPKTAFVYSVPDNNNLRADFSALPAFSSIQISLYDSRSSQHATYTRGWFDVTGHSFFQLAMPPELDPTWHVSLRPEYYRFVYANRDDADLSLYTARVDDVTNVLGN